MGGKNLRTSASALCLAVAVVGACSAVTPRSISDSYGVLTVDRPVGFVDWTNRWKDWSGPDKTPDWLTTKRLLNLRYETASGCMFRDLDIVSDATAARVPVQVLAEALMDAQRGAIDARSLGERIRARDAAVLTHNPTSIEVRERSGSEFFAGEIRGWKVQRRLSGSFEDRGDREATQTLLLLPIPKSGPMDERTRYLQVDCFTSASPEKQPIILDQMDAMQKSIRFRDGAG